MNMPWASDIACKFVRARVCVGQTINSHNRAHTNTNKTANVHWNEQGVRRMPFLPFCQKVWNIFNRIPVCQQFYLLFPPHVCANLVLYSHFLYMCIIHCTTYCEHNAMFPCRVHKEKAVCALNVGPFEFLFLARPIITAQIESMNNSLMATHAYLKPTQTSIAVWLPSTKIVDT